MKQLYPFIFFLFFFYPCFGQFSEETCGTNFTKDPDFDPQEYRLFRESFLANSLTRNQNLIYLPLSINIIRHTDQSGGFDPALVSATLDTVNRRYFDAGIQFELCDGIRYIDRDILYDFDRGLYLDTLIGLNEAGTINVYYINKVIDDASIFCGFASFPWRDAEYVVVKNSCALNGSTLAHELGHYFGLYHTHETSIGIELADGSNCVFTGDEICDTPADPRLGTYNVNDACEYTANTRDSNGDPYKPDPSNIMSYSRKECRTYFSPEQLVRIKFYQEKFRDHLIPCATTSEKSVEFSNRFALFPNPAKHKIKVKFDDEQVLTTARLVISSINGQIVFEDHWDNDEIDISGIPAGLYLVSFITRHKVYVQKLVK